MIFDFSIQKGLSSKIKESSSKNIFFYKAKGLLSLILEFVRQNHIIWGIIIFSLYLVIWKSFEKPILDFFDSKILQLFDLSNQWPLKLLFSVIIFVVVVELIKRIRKCTIVSGKIISIVLCLTLTILFYRVEKRYDFYSYISAISYADALIAIGFSYSAIGIINVFRRESNKLESNKSPFFDFPIDKESEDVLGYREEAQRLADFITELPSTECWSIGVNAEWGAGKTSFLNLVKQILRNSKFEIIDFNPRDSKDSNSIQEDFFNVLCSSLAKYNYSLSGRMKQYMAALKLIDTRNIVEKILSTYRCWNTPNIKLQVDEILSKLPLKVVVFIDDFDRLLEPEIIEIFKLLDTNASFKNLVFVTAYDKVQIHSILGGAKCNERTNFEDKFFKYEMSLPVMPYPRILAELKKMLLCYADIDVKSYKEAGDSIDSCGFILQEYIHNLRDVKRFSLQFKQGYKQVAGEVDFQDFLLITLIHYKYPSEYDDIYHEKVFEKADMLGSTSYLSLKDDQALQSFKCLDILKALFPRPGSAYGFRYRRINEKSSFPMYFTHNINSPILLKVMRRVIGNDIEEEKDTIAAWYRAELYHFFTEFVEEKSEDFIKDKDDLIRYLQWIVYLASFEMDNSIYRQFLHMLTQSTYERFQSRINMDEYKKTINDSLVLYPDAIRFFNKIYIQYNQASILSDLIYAKHEIRDLIIEEFKRYVSLHSSSEEGLLTRLYSCIDYIDAKTKTIILDKECCALARTLIEDGPDYYIESFVRLGMVSSNPTHNSITCEPFWLQIFESREEIEKFFDSAKCQKCKNIDFVKEFWALFKANDYTAIEVSKLGNVQKLLDNHLKGLFEEYRKLLDVEKKFVDYKKQHQEKSIHSLCERKTKSQTYLDTIDALHIDIKKKDDVRESVTDYIKEIESLIAHYKDVKLVEIQCNDIVRIKKEQFQKLRDKLPYQENLFFIEKMTDGQIKLSGVLNSFNPSDLEYVPIDGVSDRNIYYDPILSATYVAPGDSIPEHHFDYSYYMDALGRTFDDKGVSEKDKIKKYEFVHQVQHYLRRKYKHEDLKILYTYAL